MLTEEGFDKALKPFGNLNEQKIILPVKSFEVQKVIKKPNEV